MLSCTAIHSTELQMPDHGSHQRLISLCGCQASCHAWRDPENSLLSRRYMYVADLVALPSERGKGYGKALFEWLEDTAKSAGAARSV